MEGGGRKSAAAEAVFELMVSAINEFKDVVKQLRIDGGRCTALDSDACGVVGFGALVAWQSKLPRRCQYSIVLGQMDVTKETPMTTETSIDNENNRNQG